MATVKRRKKMSDYGPSAGASFASGFAQGFAQVYSVQKAEERREDSDLVKFNMQRFVNKKDAWNEAKKEDELIKDTAKRYAESFNLPENAWGNIYVDLRSGMTANQVQDKIATGTYTPVATKSKAVVIEEADMDATFDSSLNAQTDKLLQTTDQTTVDTPAEVDTPAKNLFQRMGDSITSAFDKDKKRQKREEKVLQKTLKNLDVSQDEYDKILAGYQVDLPELSVVYSAKKDPSKAPEWQSLANVTKDNYLSYAAEARANDDEEQAIAIETLGESIGSVNPKYADFSTMTTDNAPGRLLAAQSAGATDVATQITTWIDNNVDPDKGPKYKDYSSMTVSNSRGRLIAAQKVDDEEAIRTITDYIMEKDDAFPDEIDEKWIISQYSKFAIAATKPDATEEDKLAFQNFKDLELPAYMEAYKLVNPDEATLTFEEAWNAYYKIKGDPNANEEEIAQALKVANGAIIGMEIQEQIKDNAGKRISLVKINDDGTTTFISSAQIQMTADGQKFVDSTGAVVEDGYRPIDKDEDEAREKVVNALSTRVKTYDQNFITATGAIRLYGELAGMVIEDDRVLLKTSGIAKALSDFNKEITNTFGLIDDIFTANYGDNIAEDSVVTQDMVERRMRQQGLLAQGQTLEQLANEPVIGLPDSIEALSKRKAAFNAKLILTAFRAGGLEGQTGMAMSNKDFDRLKDVVNASKDGETFVKELGNYIQGRIDTLNDDASLLNADRGRTNFKGRYGYDPFMGENPIRSFQEVIDTPPDERFERGMQILNGDYEFADTSKQDTSVPMISTQEEYDALPVGAKYSTTDANGNVRTATKKKRNN